MQVVFLLALRPCEFPVNLLQFLSLLFVSFLEPLQYNFLLLGIEFSCVKPGNFLKQLLVLVPLVEGVGQSEHPILSQSFLRFYLFQLRLRLFVFVNPLFEFGLYTEQ